MKLFPSVLLICAMFQTVIFAQEPVAIPESNPSAAKSIGCLLPMSGEYELIGKKALRGVLLASNVFQSSDGLQVILKDAGDTPEELQKSMNELVRVDKAAIILGPPPVASIEEIGKLSEFLQIPTLVFPITEEEAGDSPYLVKFFYSLEKQADALAKYAVLDLRLKRFAVLYPENRISRLFKEAFAKSLTAIGGELVHSGSYDSTTGGVLTEIEWIRSLSPDAVFIPDGASRSGEIIAAIQKSLPANNLLFIGPNTWNSQAFLKSAAGKWAEIIFTDFFFPATPDWTEFNAKFKAQFGEKPGFLEYQVYLAAKLIMSALKIPAEDGKEMIETLADLSAQSPDFTVYRREGGGLEISPKPLILTVKKGKIIKLK